MDTFCHYCGAAIAGDAKFCPSCGVAINDLFFLDEEYSYETEQPLFNIAAVVVISTLFLVFLSVGMLVSLTEGFWIVPVILGGIVLISVLAIMWAYKGYSSKWGVNRTLWIITPKGFGCGYPPEVAKRLGFFGVFSAALTAGKQNWAVTSQGISMAKALTEVNGLPIMLWEDFSIVEYRPHKHEIAFHMLTGLTALIHTNPANYDHVEQLVRRYAKMLLTNTSLEPTSRNIR